MPITFLILVFFLTLLNTHFYSQVSGCKDSLAKNYNPNASKNDGSCEYKKLKVKAQRFIDLPDEIKETSGLFFWNKLLWTHNDDTDNFIYGIDTATGKITTKIQLAFLTNSDWEEIRQDEKYMYIGDIGNNYGNRKNLRIYRISKDDVINGNFKYDTISFSYSLQTDFNSTKLNTTNFDCEAFIVLNDSIFLFTKEWTSKKSSVYILPAKPGIHSAQFKSILDVNGLITGATFIERKNKIMLCGYNTALQPFLFLIYDFKENNFTSANKRRIELDLPFHQIEGIEFTEDGKLFLSNEKFSKSIINTKNKLITVKWSEF